jgi:tetratricopeptide (TPR) repeat protein
MPSSTGAIEDLNQAIRINPNYSFAYNGRGLAYACKAQYDRAIRDFDQAIRLYQDQAFAIPINPNFAQALSNRGAAYAFKGQYDRAIGDYDQAIRIIPDFADAFYNRGLTKRAKGDSAGGDTGIAKAKQLNPSVGN